MSNAGRTVGDVMTTRVVSLEAGEKLDLAEDIMHVGRIRHMPVVEGKKLIGIVSVRDLLAASLSQVMDFEPAHRRAFLRSVSAEEAMTRNPMTVGPDTPLAVAAGILCEQKIGCLPVVDDEETLLGLVTETDLVRAAYLESEGEERAIALESARESMRAFSARFRDDLDALRRTRDELRVQMHLARAEAREQWHALERKWKDLEQRASTLAQEAEEPMQEAREVAHDLAKELRHGYQRIRRALSD